MNRLFLAIITLWLAASAQAQSLHEGDVYRDEDTDVHYYVLGVDSAGFAWLSDENGQQRFCLNQVGNLKGVYTLEPSRPNDESPLGGTEFGWLVKQLDRYGMKVLGVYSPQEDLVHTLIEVPKPANAPDREDYRFEASIVTDNEEYTDYVLVKGFTAGNERPGVIYEEEILQRLEVTPSAYNASDWVNDTTDLNFDGIPDLQIFLGREVTGHVSEYYAGYVWNRNSKAFDKIQRFDMISNPVVHPESRTITSTTRTDAAELTTCTYTWEDGQLKLINKETSDLGSDGCSTLQQEEIAEMKRLYVADDPHENNDEVLTKWAIVSIDPACELIWISDKDEENGALFTRHNGKLNLIGTTRFNLSPSFPKSKDGKHYLVLSGPAGGPSYYYEIYMLRDGQVVDTFTALEIYGEMDGCSLNGKDIDVEKGKAYMESIPDAIEIHIDWHAIAQNE